MQRLHFNPFVFVPARIVQPVANLMQGARLMV